MSFPRTRLRRLRQHPVLREILAGPAVVPSDLVAPLFIKEGIRDAEPIASMPSHRQHTAQTLIRETAALLESGVRAVILFGIPAEKDAAGSRAAAKDGIVQQGLRRLRDEFGAEVLRIADLCLCGYTDHGHCGLARDDGVIDNDATLEAYRRVAAAQAAAGADVIAPSGMMDGQVQAIRGALDDAGFSHVAILAYAVKYASSLYGPFREAAESVPQFGDRRTYQMEPSRDAPLREAALDIEEGADIIMVKPALPYLDVLAEIRRRFDVPTAAYQVSGEYAMIKAAAAQGWIDERRAALETLTAIKRAGADMILTYFAGEVAGWLRE